MYHGLEHKEDVLGYHNLIAILSFRNISSRSFSDEVSRETPAPGGGSVSSYVGALGTSLGGMVANLSCNTRGWENKVDIFSEKAYEINQLREKLLSV